MSANTAFQLVNEKGWRRGFANILRQENANWWGSRRWWLNVLIWLAIVNGMILAMLTTAHSEGNFVMTPAMLLNEALTILVVTTGLFGAVGTVIVMQGSMIDEKQSGTAAWIMSKPVSRTAFIIAKLVANMIALPLIIVIVQSAVAYVQITSRDGMTLEFGPFLAGIALICLNMLFYLTFTLMLGTLFRDRGPVIGIPLAIIFVPMFAVNIFGQVAYLTPWLIMPAGNEPGLAVQAMSSLPLTTIMPILATIVWIVVFVVIAIWRFKREEF